MHILTLSNNLIKMSLVTVETVAMYFESALAAIDFVTRGAIYDLLATLKSIVHRRSDR